MGYPKEALTRLFHFAVALPFSAVYVYPNQNKDGGRDQLGARITRPWHDKALLPNEEGIYTIEAGQTVMFSRNGQIVFKVRNNSSEQDAPQSAKVEFYAKNGFRLRTMPLNPNQTVWGENGTLYFDPTK